MVDKPQITVVIPSYNQGQYLEKTITSLLQQNLPLEIYVMDGGSSDDSVSIIRQWEDQLAGWRSHADKGQSAAINEGIARGKAPFVYWLNSDDWLLPAGLLNLITAIEDKPDVPAVYGKAWNFSEKKQRTTPVWVEPFNRKRLALRCIIAQPAALIRRSAWEAVGGLNENLHMAMDYDLWWRLFKQFGPLHFLDEFVAVNREHACTKTQNNRRLHYQEAINTVRKHHHSVPLKWWLAQPYKVWFKSLLS